MARVGGLPLPTITDDRALGAVDIQRSLRFDDGDSAYLSRTPSSAGNRRTFTISIWVKRGHTGSGAMFGSWISDSDRATFRFSSDYIEFQNSGTSASVKTDAVFRDTAAWYHVVAAIDTTQGTQSNRGKIYVNGVQQSLSSNNITQDMETSVNNNSVQVFGTRWISGANSNFDGYLAEINLIDGQQLDASYFGFTDSQTGIWMPKRYEGTYGTNGVRLDFSDNSSAASLGIDKSPNGNDFTATNVEVSTGVGNDSVIDTPTNNFAVLSNLYGPVNTTFGEGNLLMRGGDNFAASTFLLPKSGKWYAEFSKYNNGAAQSISVTRANTAQTNYAGYLGLADNVEYVSNGEVGNRTRGSTSDATAWTDNAGVVVAVAVDMDNGAVYFAKNNTYINSGVPTSGSAKTGAIATDLLTDNNGDHVIAVHGYNANNSYGMYANFGQQPFTYTPPAGYKSLCEKNLPPNVPSLVRPKKQFDILLYSGDNATSRSITGLEFAPDLIIQKRRSDVSSLVVWDSVRGVNKTLYTEDTYAETTSDSTGYITEFGSNGFTFATTSPAQSNQSGHTYCAWCWKAGGTAVSNSDGSITSSVSVNQEAGFSIVSWTGSGADGTVGHGLGATPSMVIVKNRDSAQHWSVKHKDLTSGYNVKLNLNEAQGQSTGSTNGIIADLSSSSNFSLTRTGNTGNYKNVNLSGEEHVAYCWTDISGYSKFGSYIGNGNTDGRFVYIGFRPAWLLVKRIDSSDNWVLKDSVRNTFNDVFSNLNTNTTNAEFGSAGDVNSFDFLSNGFKIRGSNSAVNGSGGTFIYMAFAEQSGTTPFDTFPNAR